LQLLVAAYEAGGHHFAVHPMLKLRTQDTVCKLLLQTACSSDTVVLTLTLRVAYILFSLQLRKHLSMQIEVVFNTIYLRLLTTPHVSYHRQEVVLESLLDFSRLPWFFRELYINYDCDNHSTDQFENLFKALCKCVFSIDGDLSVNNVLALKCLVETLRCMRQSITSSQPKRHVNKSVLVADHKQSKQHRKELKNAYDRASTHAHIHSSNTNIRSLRAFRTEKHAQWTFKRRLLSCVREFNKDPNTGIQAFQRLGVIAQDLTTDMLQFAELLRFTPGLHKSTVGEYLGGPGPMLKRLREQYVASYNFRGMPVSDAMRSFLQGFRLPKEAQQIDRVVQCFAQEYSKQNPSVFANADAVYTLSFSMILLNTDQHSRQIKNKMTFDQFVSNNRSINDGSNVPRKVLHEIYYSIKTRELKLSGEGVTGTVNDALWTDLVRRANKREYQCMNMNVCACDEDMLDRVWDPTIAALSVVFDLGIQPFTVKLATDGFTLIAFIASSYGRHHVMDKLLSTLSKHTGLIRAHSAPFPQSQINSNHIHTHTHFTHHDWHLRRFSSERKSQLATRILFVVAKQYGHSILKGWKVVISCILHLYAIHGLPAKLCVIDDFVGNRLYRCILGSSRNERPPETRRREGSMMNTLFGQVSEFFLGKKPSKPAPKRPVPISEESSLNNNNNTTNQFAVKANNTKETDMKAATKKNTSSNTSLTATSGASLFPLPVATSNTHTHTHTHSHTKTPEIQLSEAEQRVQSLVSSWSIESLFNGAESKFLPLAAFQHLVSALCYFSSSERLFDFQLLHGNNTYDESIHGNNANISDQENTTNHDGDYNNYSNGRESYNVEDMKLRVKQILLGFQILISTLLHNRDRIDTVWNKVFKHFIAHCKPCFMEIASPKSPKTPTTKGSKGSKKKKIIPAWVRWSLCEAAVVGILTLNIHLHRSKHRTPTHTHAHTHTQPNTSSSKNKSTSKVTTHTAHNILLDSLTLLTKIAFTVSVSVSQQFLLGLLRFLQTHAVSLKNTKIRHFWELIANILLRSSLSVHTLSPGFLVLHYLLNQPQKFSCVTLSNFNIWIQVFYVYIYIN